MHFHALRRCPRSGCGVIVPTPIPMESFYSDICNSGEELSAYSFLQPQEIQNKIE